MMHNKPLRYIFIFLIILLWSCSNDNCSNDNLKQIFFFNASEEELQNVRIIGYKKDGKYTTVKDRDYKIVSFEFRTYDVHTHIATLNKDLNLGLDYKIIYDDFKDSCLISEIVDDEAVCKQILLFKEHSHKIDGYQMNGKPFACDVLKAFPSRSK